MRTYILIRYWCALDFTHIREYTDSHENADFPASGLLKKKDRPLPQPGIYPHSRPDPFYKAPVRYPTQP
jgi:hypothetical protein